MIHLLTAASVDVLTGPDGARTVRAGGPDLFVTVRLRAEGCPFRHVVAPSRVAVGIDVFPGGETGRVLSCEPLAVPPPSSPDFLLVSTVGPDAPVGLCAGLDVGTLYLDFQGVVRGRAKPLGIREFRERFLFRRFVGKATLGESRLLGRALVRFLREKHALIVTDGPCPVRVLAGGSERRYAPRRLGFILRDTIGAGDTFFAAFAARHRAGASVPSAVRHALASVRDFLYNK